MNPLSCDAAESFCVKYKLSLASVFCLYFIVFIGAYIVHFKELTYPLFDDGMITLEYAKNFARHGSLTVGGDSQWTAGFTSWAWMLILSVLSLIPVSEFHLPVLVPFLNTGILFLSLWLFCRVSTKLNGKPPGWAYWGLALTTPSILFWTFRGMEVPLSMLTVALIANSVVAISNKEQPETADLLTFWSISLIVIFIRPELAAVVLVCSLYLFVVKNRTYAAIASIMLLMAGFLGYVILNKSVFNQFFTNSYFLKIIGVSEFQKLLRGIWSIKLQLSHNSLYIVMFFAVAITMAIKTKPHISKSSKSLLSFFRDSFKNSPYTIPTLIVITITLSWIWFGGDAWEELPLLNRFIVVCVPIACMLIDKALGSSNEQIKGMAFALALCFISLNTAYSIKTIGLGSFNDKRFSYIGYRLGEMFGNSAVTMHYWYGLPSYYSSINQGRSIDGLGKIDPVVSHSHPMLSFKPGHDRWNHAHSIGELKPDLIVNMPCPSPHDLKFNCSTVWDEITVKYGYKPHTAADGSLTLFVSPFRPDLNDAVEKFEADAVTFTNKL